MEGYPQSNTTIADLVGIKFFDSQIFFFVNSLSLVFIELICKFKKKLLNTSNIPLSNALAGPLFLLLPNSSNAILFSSELRTSTLVP